MGTNVSASNLCLPIWGPYGISLLGPFCGEAILALLFFSVNDKDPWLGLA